MCGHLQDTCLLFYVVCFRQRTKNTGQHFVLDVHQEDLMNFAAWIDGAFPQSSRPHSCSCSDEMVFFAVLESKLGTVHKAVIITVHHTATCIVGQDHLQRGHDHRGKIPSPIPPWISHRFRIAWNE